MMFFKLVPIFKTTMVVIIKRQNSDNNLILQNRSFAEGADACISLRFRTFFFLTAYSFGSEHALAVLPVIH